MGSKHYVTPVIIAGLVHSVQVFLIASLELERLNILIS